MKLYLVRHGETDWNLENKIQGHTDTVLNEKGIQQAGELAGKLEKEYRIDKIYTSRNKRARGTAEIIGERLGIAPRPRQGLEEINFGKWEGCTWQQVKENFSEEYQVWHRNRRYHVPPMGESYQQLLDRLLPALDGIMKENAPPKDSGDKQGCEGEERGDQNLLVVTHSAVIMTLMSYIYDTPFEDMARNYRTGNAEIVEMNKGLFYQRYSESKGERR